MCWSSDELAARSSLRVFPAKADHPCLALLLLHFLQLLPVHRHQSREVLERRNPEPVLHDDATGLLLQRVEMLLDRGLDVAAPAALEVLVKNCVHHYARRSAANEIRAENWAGLEYRAIDAARL